MHMMPEEYLPDEYTGPNAGSFDSITGNTYPYKICNYIIMYYMLLYITSNVKFTQEHSHFVLEYLQ